MKYRLVIFDMDGTLTEEAIDFVGVRSEMGVPEGVGVLEFLAGDFAAGERERLVGILHRHEMSAAEACGVRAGAVELVRELRGRGVKVALLTRNTKACVAVVMGRFGMEMDAVATREDLPHKPHGDSIMNLVRRFGVERGETLMVGDYKYDVGAAAEAGVDCALLWDREGEVPGWGRSARYVVRGIGEVVGIVKGDS